MGGQGDQQAGTETMSDPVALGDEVSHDSNTHMRDGLEHTF